MFASGLTLPVENPVVVFAIVMLIILVAPLVFTRLRIPGIVGLIVAGVVIGPHTLDVLARDDTMELLGTVGLLYIMFVAGLEIDLNEFSRYRRQSLLFSVLTFGLPQLLGTLGGLYLLDLSGSAAVLLGSIIASHTLVAYPAISRLGLSKNKAVTTAVGATIITDSLALFVLAVVAGSAEGDVGVVFWVRLLASLAVYVAAVFLIVPRLGRWFFQATGSSDGVAGYVFILAVVFTVASLAEVAGVEPIIGAFLAGLALNRLVPEQGTLMNRISFVGDSLFIPFFLISVGMLIDLGTFVGSPSAWAVAGIIIGAVLAAKWIAAFATKWIFGFSTDQSWMIFGLTVAQAAATLAAVLIGNRIGLFSGDVLNATILMILITCLIGPWLAERYGRRVARAEAQEPFEPTVIPQRILIPVIDQNRAEQLMELALLIRDHRSTQPIFPLTVVREGAGAAPKVAGIEKLKALAVRHGAAVDVPVVPLTRVDASIPNAVVRALTEEQITTVVIGWDGENQARQHVFGHVIDRLLENSREMILISKMQRPVNTVERVVVITPPFIDREPGFSLAFRTAKVLSSQIGARLAVLCTGEGAPVLQPTLAEIRPQLDTTFITVPSWSDLTTALDDTLAPDDLLVVLGVRKGSLAWRPGMDRLPKVIARRFSAVSQIFLYLSEIAFDAAETPGALPAEELVDAALLLPEQICVELDVQENTWDGALHHILGPSFGQDTSALGETIKALVDRRSGYAPERHPGLVLLHARVPSLHQGKLCVGVSKDGLKLPGTAHHTHVILILLAPEPPTSEAYLTRLTAVTQLIRGPGMVSRLQTVRSADDVHDVLMSSMHAPLPT